MKKKLAVLLALLVALSAVPALADYGAILKRDARVYADAKLRTPLGTVPKYLAVVVKSVKSGRATIGFRGRTVYIKNKDLSRPWRDLLKHRKRQGIEHTEDCLRYVKKRCYVYDYPGKGGKKLKRVGKGSVLTGFMEKDGWSIVMDRGEKYYGYIRTSNLEGISGGDGAHYPLG